METLWQDVRYGARTLLRSPGFTLVAVLTLALGIGATSAIFSVAHAVALRPLPYPESRRLVFLSEWSQQVENMSFSLANFHDLHEQNRVFDGLFAMRSQNHALTGEGAPERLAGRQVTAGSFGTLGVQPLVGRTFTAEEDRPGSERVALLGEGFWTRRFGRDPGVVGRRLLLDNEPCTVIGVLPGAALHGDWRRTDVWTSLGRLDDVLGGPERRGNHPGIYVLGRLRAGVSVEQARADVVGLAARLAEQYPASNARHSMTVRPALEALVGDLRPALLVLLGAVACVLLIACANVANLLLARSATRRKEIAVRSALGAGRGRVVRQLLTESVLLALAGGLLGLALAFAGVAALRAVLPAETPRLEEIGVDADVLLFTLGATLATALLFGLLPALQTTRGAGADGLKDAARGSSGRGPQRARALLIVSEVSLALVLLVGAGLMLKSLAHLLDADPGFDPRGVTTMTVSLPQAGYEDPARAGAFFERVLAQLEGVPGIEAYGTTAPLLGGWQTSFQVEGRPEPPPGQEPSTDITRVSPGYFRAMGVRLVRGRVFDERDREGRPEVCVVDEKMAAAYWPGQDPIGKRLRLSSGGTGERPWISVVGVVRHVKNYGVDQESRVETYLPQLQSPLRFATFVVRAPGDPAGAAAAVRRALHAVDAGVPLFAVRGLEDVAADARAGKRLAAQLLAGFALLALVLAAIGIYGVTSHAVTQRTLEIGIRVALGAERGHVLGLVIGQGLRLAGLGMAIGLALSWALGVGLAHALGTLLFRVDHADPPTYAGVPLLLGAVALLACWLPARRALRVEPVRALRCD